MTDFAKLTVSSGRLQKVLFFILVACGLTISAPAFADGGTYDAGDARKFLKVSGVKSIPNGKVAITEFVIEYVTDTSKGPDGSGLVGRLAMTGLKKAGVGRSQTKIPEEAKLGLVADLYPILVAALEEQGLAVLPLETLAESEAYAFFATETGGARSRTTDYQHLTGVVSREKTETYSIGGLAVQKGGAFGQMKNLKASARLMSELGVERTLEVRIRVGLDKQHLSFMEGSEIYVTTGFNKTHMPGGKEIFNPKKTGLVRLKKDLVHGANVVEDVSKELGEGKVTTVNADQMRASGAALMEGYSAMVASKL